jgi:hypothetical protein
LKALGKNGTRKDISMERHLLAQPSKRREPHVSIKYWVEHPAMSLVRCLTLEVTGAPRCRSPKIKPRAGASG